MLNGSFNFKDMRAFDHVEVKHRHVGIAYSAFGWFLIAFGSIFFTQTRATHSLINNGFHHYLAAFMATSIWASFKNKQNFFCKNPFLVLINSLICMCCYYITLVFKVAPAYVSNPFLLNSDPLILALVLALLFRKKISLLSWLGLVLGFVGVMCFFGFKVDFSTSQALLDSFKCLTSAFLLVVLVLFTWYLLKHNPPVVIVLSHCLVGLVCSGVLLFFYGWQLPTNFELFCMAVDGFTYGLALYFFITALKFTEVYIVASMGYLLPVFIIALNLMLKRVGYDVYTLTGTCIVLVGVSLVPIPAYLKRYTDVGTTAVQ